MLDFLIYCQLDTLPISLPYSSAGNLVFAANGLDRLRHLASRQCSTLLLGCLISCRILDSFPLSLFPMLQDQERGAIAWHSLRGISIEWDDERAIRYMACASVAVDSLDFDYVQSGL